MKTIKWVAILLLGLSVIWLLLDRQGYRTSFNDGYQTKVRSLESQIEVKEVANRNLLAVADSIATENAGLNGRRIEAKTKWRDKFIEVKADCDSVNLSELEALHITSELVCDTMLFNKDLQIDALKEVISNDSVIVQAKDSIIDLYSTAYVELEEKADKDKKKSFRRGLKIGFGTGFVSGFISRKFLENKE